jgi:hypothetical protein
MSNYTFSAGVARAGDVSPSPSTRSGLSDGTVDFDAIVELAREAGMLITLDGQIGREKYQSIEGSLSAFRRFIDALRGRPEEQVTA